MRFLSVVIACLVGSAGVSGAQVRGLRILDSTRIQDTDTLFVTRPNEILLGPGGHAFMLEAREARVVDIAPTGKIERIFGRKGKGPGEFESPSRMAISGDTLLAVYDHSTKRVSFINLPSWTLNRVSPLLARWSPDMKFVGSDVLVGAWDFDTKTSFAKVVEGSGTLEEKQGIIPSLGDQTQLLITGAFWNSTFAPIGGDIFAMYEVSNNLFTWKRGSRDAREIVVPKRRRRGVDAERFQAMFRDPSEVTPAMAFDRSIPVAIAPLARDIVAIVTMDPKIENDKWYAIHHVTLYNRSANRACVDLEVPATRTRITFGSDPLPPVALRGDTLALVEQTGGVDDPAYTIRRYRIDPSQCEWLPITR